MIRLLASVRPLMSVEMIATREHLKRENERRITTTRRTEDRGASEEKGEDSTTRAGREGEGRDGTVRGKIHAG